MAETPMQPHESAATPEAQNDIFMDIYLGEAARFMKMYDEAGAGKARITFGQDHDERQIKIEGSYDQTDPYHGNINIVIETFRLVYGDELAMDNSGEEKQRFVASRHKDLAGRTVYKAEHFRTDPWSGEESSQPMSDESMLQMTKFLAILEDTTPTHNSFALDS